MRAAPTDAFGGPEPEDERSTTGGLHQSLTTLGGVFGRCGWRMTLTHNNTDSPRRPIPSVFAIFMLLYYVSTPNRLQTKHYGMPKYPARPAPSKKRHGRGPLAMVYEPVRWRRSACKDKSRDLAYIRGKRTWRRVGEWLAEHLDEMKRRAQRFKEKRPGEKLFPQLRRQEGEPEEDWQTRQREWEAEYLSAEAELKYRGFRRGFRRALTSANYPLTADDRADGSVIASALITNARRGRRRGHERSSSRREPRGRAGDGVGHPRPALPEAPPGGALSTEKKVAWGAGAELPGGADAPSEFWRALLVFTTLKVAGSRGVATLHANQWPAAAYLPC